MADSAWTRIARSVVADLGRSLLKGAGLGSRQNRSAPTHRAPASRSTARSTTKVARPDNASGTYPGDYTGPISASYSPTPDGQADPGEIVWAWIPYEEDHSRGKDRPALIVGLDRSWLLALQVTSQDHDRDAEQEARAGRYWMDIGTGGWDRKGRPSEVRLNRVIRLDPSGVRREGAALDRATFDAVIAAAAAHA